MKLSRVLGFGVLPAQEAKRLTNNQAYLNGFMKRLVINLIGCAKSRSSFGICFVAFEPGVEVDWQGDSSFQDTMSALKCGKHTTNTMNRKSSHRFRLIFHCVLEAPLLYRWEALRNAMLRRTHGRQVLHSSFTLGGASLPEWLRGWT